MNLIGIQYNSYIIIGFTLFKNVRKSKNVRSYHSNQVAWQRSANKDGSFFQISDTDKAFLHS